MSSINNIMLLVVITYLTSCSMGGPRKAIMNNHPKSRFIQKEYVHQQLNWYNYVYFHDSIYQGRRAGISFAQQDSILNIVKPIFLKQQQLSIIKSGNLINKVSPEISNLNVLYNEKKIKDEMILKHIHDSAIYIFPVFCSGFGHRHTMSAGYSGSWVYSASDKITIVVYIIDKKQVIYKRSARLYADITQDPNNPNQNLRTIKQEHWQLIIDKALEDYIKRLKVPADGVKSKN